MTMETSSGVHPKIKEELKQYPVEVQELIVEALQGFGQGLTQQEVMRKLEYKMRKLVQGVSGGEN
ncbi:hypothetical protein [Paenibacillus xylaniclasticus]|uniref:hypothetical protein n=1 Tax=Paenibacillus xylaniclasticus TaxID=588083 RepID=UPI000FDAF3B2|nr:MULTISPECIES: hypothetical protein [Paenibacillus]GFN30442.1 hypothetical protein PCURB6_07020 [Paenibacillus curdlanolyticus]